MEGNLQLTSLLGDSGGSLHTWMGTIYHAIRTTPVLQSTAKFGSQGGMWLCGSPIGVLGTAVQVRHGRNSFREIKIHVYAKRQT